MMRYVGFHRGSVSNVRACVGGERSGLALSLGLHVRAFASTRSQFAARPIHAIS